LIQFILHILLIGLQLLSHQGVQVPRAPDQGRLGSQISQGFKIPLFGVQLGIKIFVLSLSFRITERLETILALTSILLT
jgi:hypothetical protein